MIIFSASSSWVSRSTTPLRAFSTSACVFSYFSRMTASDCSRSFIIALALFTASTTPMASSSMVFCSVDSSSRRASATSTSFCPFFAAAAALTAAFEAVAHSTSLALARVRARSRASAASDTHFCAALSFGPPTARMAFWRAATSVSRSRSVGLSRSICSSSA